MAEGPLLALGRHFSRISVCPLLDQSGQSRIFAGGGLSAFDPKRTYPGVGNIDQF
jgi:hypothetical protein